MSDDKQKLIKKRADIAERRKNLREAITDKKKEIGVMNITSHADPSYSSAKLANWQIDLDALEAKLAELEAELSAIDMAILSAPNGKPKDAVPPAVFKLQTRATELQRRRQELAAEREKVQSELANKRGTMGGAVAKGHDIGKLSGEISALEVKISVIEAGMQSIDDELMAIGVSIRLEESQAAVLRAEKLIAEFKGQGLQLLKDTNALRVRAREISAIAHDIKRLKAEYHLESASLSSQLYKDETLFAGELFFALDSLRRRIEKAAPAMLERANIKREF